MIRLDKFLADMGFGTRSEMKKCIKNGLVSVDGVKALKGDQKIDAATSRVMFEGQEVRYMQHIYYMLHKPAGYISATKDHKDKTVTELLPADCKKDVFPVGRLDKDTEGLLLLTNNGALAHELLSPKKHVAKTYYAKIEGVVTEEDVIKFKEGMDIGEKRDTLPAGLEIVHSGLVSEVRITICEGKYHQIKRMFGKVGKPVIYLKRLTMGSLVLDEQLKPGECRPLTEHEIEALHNFSK